MRCEHIAEAEIALKCRDLARSLAANERLNAAWERGRFLGDVRDLAASAATVDEAEEVLGLDTGQLSQQLAVDRELADVWNHQRLQLAIALKGAMVAKAKEGNRTAILQIEAVLKREIGRLRGDLGHVTLAQMMDITGKSRQTIHEWVTLHGLNRNADRTFDLATFFAWFERFTLAKDRPQGSAKSDPLKDMKAQRLRQEIAEKQGQLLSRDEVMAGIIARHQALVNAMDAGAEGLAVLCHGQPPAEIARIIQGAFADIRNGLCTAPDELRLPAAAAAALTQILKGLAGHSPSAGQGANA